MADLDPITFVLPKADPEANPPVTFDINGETFRCRRVSPIVVLDHFGRVLRGGSVNFSELATIWRAILADDDAVPATDEVAAVPSSIDRFIALTEAGDVAYGLSDLWDMWQTIAARIVGRPTLPLSGSQDGPDSTGPTSEPAAANVSQR